MDSNDDLLSCNICKELYVAPMALPCLHSFCSICIRKHITLSTNQPGSKLGCPCCLKPFNGINELRKNALLEDIVEYYGRKAKQNPVIKPDTIKEVVVNESSQLDSKHEIVKESKHVSERPKRQKMESPNETKEVDPKIVECPLCFKNVEFKKLNRHMDLMCRTDYIQASANPIEIESEPESSLKHKPSLAYNFVKDQKLRKLLQEEGLSCRGDRKSMIKRHSQWILFYNANCDRKTPLSVDILRSQFLKQEEEVEVRDVNPFGDPSNASHEYTVEGQKGIEEHAIRYKNEFQELIEKAKNSKRMKTANKF